MKTLCGRRSFSPQARSALEYYSQLLSTEHVFEKLYMIGWDRFFQLGYHEAGKEEQKNPPLLPEVLAAAAAIDFFTAPPGPPQDEVQILMSARQSGR